MIVNEQALERVTLRERSLEITRQLGRINTDNLKEEVEDSGADSIFWGVQAAHASADAEKAKLRVEVVKAEIGKQRRQQNTLGGAKSTERSIEEDIILDERYQAAMAAQIDAFERAGVLNSVRFAVDRKQKTLESLSNLLTLELMARRSGLPSSPDDAQREELRKHMAGVVPAKRTRREVSPPVPATPSVPTRSAVQ